LELVQVVQQEQELVLELEMEEADFQELEHLRVYLAAQEPAQNRTVGVVAQELRC